MIDPETYISASPTPKLLYNHQTYSKVQCYGEAPQTFPLMILLRAVVISYQSGQNPCQIRVLSPPFKSRKTPERRLKVSLVVHVVFEPGCDADCNHDASFHAFRHGGAQ